MIDVVSHAINYFYNEKQYDTFIALCQKKAPHFKELEEYITLNNLFLSIGLGPKDSASVSWTIESSPFVKGDFQISYKTTLEISKVAPLFYIQHQFEIVNKDEAYADPNLSDYGDNPYSKQQIALDKKIVTVLEKKEYHRLFSYDTDEVIEGLRVPQGVTIYGPQVNVELLLFVDIFRICNHDDDEDED